MSQAEIDIRAVNGGAGSDGGVEHGALLVAFVEAVMGNDEERLGHERNRLRAALSEECFVDVAATIGAFNVVDRIADATGIPLDEAMRELSGDTLRELDLSRFASAVNTPGAGPS